MVISEGLIFSSVNVTDGIAAVEAVVPLPDSLMARWPNAMARTLTTRAAAARTPTMTSSPSARFAVGGPPSGPGWDEDVEGGSDTRLMGVIVNQPAWSAAGHPVPPTMGPKSRNRGDLWP